MSRVGLETKRSRLNARPCIVAISVTAAVSCSPQVYPSNEEDRAEITFLRHALQSPR